MSERPNIIQQPAVFVTIELHKKGTLDPLLVGDLIGDELISIQNKGCDISSITFVRGIAGTPEED